MVENFKSFGDVIDAFGGPAAYSRALGIPAFHGQTMKTRDSIPAAHWAATVEAARRRRITGITLKMLAELKAKRKAA